MSTYAVSLKMSMLDGVTPSYRNMTSAANLFAKAQRSAVNGFNSVMNIGKGVFVGNTISQGFGAARNAIAEAGYQWVQFDKETRTAASRWDSVLDGTTSYNKALAETKDTTIAVSQATKFTAAEVAMAMNNMAASGYSLQQANRETMLSIGKFATIADTDMSTATASLTGSMAAWKVPFSEAQNHAAEMAVAANASRMSIMDLSEATKVAGSAYSAAGLKSRGFYAMLMAMSKVGIVGAEAGTRARGTLTALYRPQTIKELSGNKVSIMDSAKNLRDPLEIIKDLRGELLKLGTAEQGIKLKKMFEQYELSSVAQLLQTSDIEWNQIYGSFSNATQKMETQFGQVNAAITNKWQLLKSAFMAKFIVGAEAGSSPLATLIDQLTVKVSAFDTGTMVKFIQTQLPTYIDSAVNSFKTIGIVLSELSPMVQDIYNAVRPLLPILPMLVELGLKLWIVQKGFAIGSAVASGWSALIPVFSTIGTWLSANGALLLWNAEILGGGALMAVIGWGAVFVAVVALVIHWVSTFIDHWQKITYMFEKRGVVDGFKAMYVAALDFAVWPLDLIIKGLNMIGILSDRNYEKWSTFRASWNDVPASTINPQLINQTGNFVPQFGTNAPVTQPYSLTTGTPAQPQQPMIYRAPAITPPASAQSRTKLEITYKGDAAKNIDITAVPISGPKPEFSMLGAN